MQDIEKAAPSSETRSMDEVTINGSPECKRNEIFEKGSPKAAFDARLSEEEQMHVSEKPYPETDLSRSVIGWEGQHDPENPRTFSMTKKWGLVGTMSAVSLVAGLASSMFSPAMESVAIDFKETNRELLSFTVSVFLFGFAFGPLLLAPLSEIYGRKPVLDAANWFFTIWEIGCAKAPNIECLIVFRVFAGIGGSACLTLGAGVIADMFPVEQRGLATSVWGLGPLVGPILGPIMGGFIGERKGWRWVFWILTIFAGTTSAAFTILSRETYAPVLLERKTKRLRRELGRNDLVSVYQAEGEVTSAKETLAKAMKVPFILLTRSPILILMSLYIALVYGLMYLFFTTIPSVFKEQYGFSPGITGLAYLGLGIGFALGLFAVGFTSDPLLRRMAAKNNGVATPEMRLPVMIVFSCILPISFFWYGWATDKHAHWIVPIIGTVPFACGVVGVWMPIQTYVIDCYPEYAASANAALACARSILGATLPLAGPKMFESLGLGWGNSLLGFIALVFVPIPILFNRHGARIREKFPVNLG